MEDGGLKVWSDLWNSDNIGWHTEAVDKYLMNYMKRYDGKEWSHLNVLVPLCGKTVDIKWLLDKGCSVVGVEGVDLAVKSIFQQHKLSSTSTSLQASDRLYQCGSHPLKVFNCNIFDFPKYNTEKFDIVWDRGGYGSMPSPERKKYVEVMRTLYAPDYHHLISALTYDEAEYSGHPFNISLSIIKQDFGERVHVDILETVDELAYGRSIISANLTAIHRNIFLIKP